MGKHVFSLYRPLPRRLSAYRHCTNGSIVQARAGGQVASAFGHVVQWRRKVILTKALDLDSITLGVAGTTNRWRFRFRSGYQAQELGMAFVIARADGGAGIPGGNTPYVDCQLTEVGVGTTTSSALHYGLNTVGAPDDTTDEFSFQKLRMDLSPATEYEGLIRAVEYARPVAVQVFELAPTEIDDTLTAGINPNGFVRGGDIYDSQVVHLHTSGNQLWKQNASVLMSWSADQSSDAPAITSASYTNVLDGASTSVTANTPGFVLDTQYHNTISESNVPVEFAVYAERTAGTDSCNVRLNDGTNTIIAGPITTAGWYTATSPSAGNVAAQAATKWDLQASSGGAGSTVKVWAATLAEYEA